MPRKMTATSHPALSRESRTRLPKSMKRLTSASTSTFQPSGTSAAQAWPPYRCEIDAVTESPIMISLSPADFGPIGNVGSVVVVVLTPDVVESLFVPERSPTPVDFGASIAFAVLDVEGEPGAPEPAPDPSAEVDNGSAPTPLTVSAVADLASG